MKRKILIILLSMAILFTFMPLTAYAGDPDNGWDSTHTYYYDSGSMISGGWFYVDEDQSWYYFSDSGAVKKGWIEDIDYCYYGDPKTGALWKGWKKINGYWYYFSLSDEDMYGYDEGRMYDAGPMQVNGKYYFFAKSDNASKWGKMQYGWVSEKNDYGNTFWYYADSGKDGQLVSGWKKINNKWYYFETADLMYFNYGTMYYDGSYKIKDNYYFFGPDGDMKTGWVKQTYNGTYEDGRKFTYTYWYYGDPNNDGRLVTGWKKINGKWYWFYGDGEMFANDTMVSNGKLYAFNRDGSLHETAGWVDLYEEWIDANGKKVKESYWVYTDANGVAKTGWQKISGEWYYFDDWGYMYYDEFAYDSQGTMWLGSNGKIVKNKWIKNPYDDEWYFAKANGYIAMNEWAKDSAGWLYMDSEGKILRNGWAKDSKGWCWMNDNGRITKNAWVADYNHYVGPDGYMYANCEMEIDGSIYYFDENGYGTWMNPHG